MASNQRSKFATFWALILILLTIVGGLVLFRDVIFGTKQSAQQPAPPSSEWTTAPEEGVPVNLPEIPVRELPIEETPSQDTPQPDQE